MDIEWLILGIVVIIFLSTTLRSIFGFGDAVIAMPLLSFLLDLKTATPLYSMIALTISFFIVLQTWKDIKKTHLWRLLLTTSIGIPLGLYFLRAIDEHLIKAILGIIIIIFSLYNLMKPIIITHTHKIYAYLFGFIAGILGGAYNVNGPPIVCFAALKKWDPQSFRATLQGYFFVTGLFLVTSHYLIGNMTKMVFETYIMVIPVIIGAILLGTYIQKKISTEYFIKSVHFLLFFLGVLLVVNALF